MSTHFGVSSKDIQKARQNALRIRASVACFHCKSGKIKCSDYRPCKNCAGRGQVCLNQLTPIKLSKGQIDSGKALEEDTKMETLCEEVYNGSRKVSTTLTALTHATGLAKYLNEFRTHPVAPIRTFPNFVIVRSLVGNERQANIV